MCLQYQYEKRETGNKIFLILWCFCIIFLYCFCFLCHLPSDGWDEKYLCCGFPWRITISARFVHCSSVFLLFVNLCASREHLYKSQMSFAYQSIHIVCFLLPVQCTIALPRLRVPYIVLLRFYIWWCCGRRNQAGEWGGQKDLFVQTKYHVV